MIAHMTKTTLEQAVSYYLAEIRHKFATRNFTEYYRTLYRFKDFVGEREVGTITADPQLYELFYNHLLEDYHLNASSVYNHFLHLKQFLVYCVSVELITFDVDIIKVLNFEKHRSNNTRHFANLIPEAIYPFDEKLMSNYWLKQEPGFISTRNAAFINLLFDTGIKLGELLSITIEDVDFTKFFITLRSKNARTIHFPKETGHLLLQYLKLRDDKCPYLWVNHTNKYLATRINGRSLERIITFTSMQCGCLTEITPAMIRNSYLAKAVASGADRNKIIAELGIRHYHQPNINKFSLNPVLQDERSSKNTSRYLSDFSKKDILVGDYKLTLDEEKRVIKSSKVEWKIVSRTLLLRESDVIKFVKKVQANYEGFIAVPIRQKQWGLSKDLFKKFISHNLNYGKTIDKLWYIHQDISHQQFISAIKNKAGKFQLA